MKVRLNESTGLSTREFTSSGLMRAKAVLGKPGVAEYPSDMLGLDGDRRMVKVMRTAESLFHPETVAKLRGLPIISGHKDITPRNYRGSAVGNIVGEPERTEDDVLVADILIGDQQAIDGVGSGQRDDISIGYDVTLRQVDNNDDYEYITDGPYDPNHVGLAEMGRSGPDVRVMDSLDGGFTMDEKDLALLKESIRAALVDAIPSTPEAPALDVPTLVAALADAITPRFDAINENIAKINEERLAQARLRDEAESKAKAEAAEARAKQAAEEFEAKIREEVTREERNRASVLSLASTTLTTERIDALQDADTRTILLEAVGDEVSDKENRDEGYLTGALSIIANRRQTAATAPATATATVTDSSDVEKARQSMIENLSNAYKQPFYNPQGGN